jgi:hypothetical protein
MTTENVETKIYKSLPQPNEDKPITVDTFSPCPVLISRIRKFNGVKIDLNVIAVYGYLLGWKKTTGRVTVSIPRISDDCAGISESTVKRARKALKKMGWIDWKTIPDEGKSNTSHCIYTVKDPEDILAELNAGLSQQGDAVVTIAKNQKVKTGESGKDEQKQQDDEQPVTTTSAAAAGVGKSVPPVGVPVDDALPIDDNAPLNGPDGENVVEFPRSGRPKLSFKFVSPDDDDLENYSEAPQVDFDKDGQPPNKWKDFDMATTCDFL